MQVIGADQWSLGGTMFGLLRAIAIVALAGTSAGMASAADMPVKAPKLPAAGPSAVLFGGFAVDQPGWFADAGAVYSLNGNLAAAGWLIRARGGAGHYVYNRTATLEQGVNYQVGELMLGRQLSFGRVHLTGYAGANVEHHNNNDPLATVVGTRWGFKAQGELYADLSPQAYALLLGTYSTAWNSYFALGKLGYKISNAIAIGPEVAAMGNERYDVVRAGPFVAFNLTAASQIIFSGGYSWDQRKTALNDSSGAYGTIHLRREF